MGSKGSENSVYVQCSRYPKIRCSDKLECCESRKYLHRYKAQRESMD